MKVTDGWTDFDFQRRTIQATWLTDVAYKDGVRQVTLTAKHYPQQGYYVTAAIATRKEENGLVYTLGVVFEDPIVSLFREKGRYSAKRLENLFDTTMAGFDVEKFYAHYEKAGV